MGIDVQYWLIKGLLLPYTWEKKNCELSSSM